MSQTLPSFQPSPKVEEPEREERMVAPVVQADAQAEDPVTAQVPEDKALAPAEPKVEEPVAADRKEEGPASVVSVHSTGVDYAKLDEERRALREEHVDYAKLDEERRALRREEHERRESFTRIRERLPEPHRPFVDCTQEIGVAPYRPQKEQRDVETPDHVKFPDHPQQTQDNPLCSRLTSENWMRLGEAELEQFRRLQTDCRTILSRSGRSRIVLDQVAFVAKLKEALAQSTVQLTLDEEDVEAVVKAAVKQPITSFDDFPHLNIQEVKVTVGVGNKLQTFQAECARNNEVLFSFANSRYRHIYDKDGLRARSVEEAWRLVWDFLHLLPGKPGFSVMTASRHEYLEEENVRSFYRTLRLQFERNGVPLTTQSSHSEREREWAASETLVRCWTDASLCEPLKREWCSLLQQGVRMNHPDLVCVVAKIWATMNVYCVKDRKIGGPARDIAWPGEQSQEMKKEGKNPNKAEEKCILHRGARLHKSTLEWWDEQCRTKEIFRVPGAVAVSKLSTKALYFMKCISQPEEQPMVYYRFHFKETGACDHAVCLDVISLCPGEEEFLFPPFSSFQAFQKRWVESEDGGHYIIDIAIVKNNQAAPADVPLCPWL